VNVFPTTVNADLETAIHNTMTTAWPGLEVKACRLNLGQSWWRKIQSSVLSKPYGKKDSEARKFLQNIFGLSLLLLAEVCDSLCWNGYTIFRTTSEWNSFVTLLENYIDADSNFPLLVWSECTA
jgi:hypothetical protein